MSLLTNLQGLVEKGEVPVIRNLVKANEDALKKLKDYEAKIKS
jgi:hypothetical protein